MGHVPTWNSVYCKNYKESGKVQNRRTNLHHIYSIKHLYQNKKVLQISKKMVNKKEKKKNKEKVNKKKTLIGK